MSLQSDHEKKAKIYSIGMGIGILVFGVLADMFFHKMVIGMAVGACVVMTIYTIANKNEIGRK